MRGLARGLRAVAVCSLLTSSLACSFTMRTRAADWDESQKPVCDAEGGKPALDGMVGILGGLVGASMLLSLEDCESGDGGGPCGPGNAAAGAIGVTSLVVAALYGSSAVYGFMQQRKCRQARTAHDKWRASRARHARHARRQPAAGAADGRCYDNQTCDRALVCASGTCTPGSSNGHEDGACFGNGTCFDPFACLAGRCRRRAEAAAPPDAAAPARGRPLSVSPAGSSASTTEPSTPAAAPRGRDGGECFGNGTCLGGLHCVPETHRCRAGAVGSAGATCYPNDTCDIDLVCDTTAWRCVAAPPAERDPVEAVE